MLSLTKKSKPTKLQHELAKLDQDIATDAEKLTQAEAKVQRLHAVIATASAQEATLASLMAQDDGTALERLAAGEGDATDIGVIADRVHRAVQAATAARVTLPGAEAAAADAQAVVERRKQERSRMVLQVVLGQADQIAAEYKRAFETLLELHDELRAASQAVGLTFGDASFSLVDEAIEVPRFELPALKSEGVYSTYLRGTPDTGRINARAAWWRGLIMELSANALADASAVQPAEISKTPGVIFHAARRHADENLTMADTLHAPRYDRPSLAAEPVRGQA